MEPYKPHFFSSLFRSCYDGHFYERIDDISFARTIIFLILYSLLIAVSAIGVLAFFWSHIFPAPDFFLRQYDELIPDSFQGVFNGTALEVTPSPLDLYVGFEADGSFALSTESPEAPIAHFLIDTTQALDTPLANDASLEVAVRKEGVVLSNRFYEEPFLYRDLESDAALSFDKPMLRGLLAAGLPYLEDSLKNALIITGPLLIFAYHIIGAFVIGVLYSFLGMVVLLLMNKDIRYGFLIKLSIYASVPAFIISLVTAVLGISVSFVPVFIFSAFYFYGLMVYDPNR